MTNFVVLCLVLMLSGFFTSCSSITDPDEKEIDAMALKAYNEVKTKSKISTHAEWTAMLNRVAPRIAAASGEKNFKWEWMLIDSPEINAWCMPGGKMAVYTGIMPVLQNEAALAAVLGHEVAHATERHGKERYARAVKGSIAGLVIGGAAIVGGQLLCKTETCRQLSGLGGAAAGFAISFFDRKFSRADETEADKAGQTFMAKAGYEPGEAIKLWERMGAASKGAAPPEFMSTHPSDVTRRKNLSEWLPDAQAVYTDAPEKHGLGQPIK
ncbi:MAG TPA: M48 family metallopeptidase [Bacteriovoracaceae bacterium]|nr:M48 family metallopeptidase [Bacteriovoracaceae bacterium]